MTAPRPHTCPPREPAPDRWSASSEENPERFSEIFETREEAIAHGHHEVATDGQFYLHRIRRMRPSTCYGDELVDRLLERLSEDEACWEDDDVCAGDRWREPLRELEQQLDDIILTWFNKHDAWAEFNCYEVLSTELVEDEVVHAETKTVVG